MGKILVLGSEGQIGYHLCKHLKSNGHDVDHFDLVNGDREDLRYIGDDPNQIGLNDYDFKNVDFVFFLAFDVGGSHYLEKYQNTYEFVDNNMRIMVNTFHMLKKHKVPFIFASSQMSNMNYSIYGRLKAIGEHYTKLLNGLTVKFWNVYGVEKDPEKTHVVTDFIMSAKNDGVIHMRTNGEEMRQMLHADDCSSALEALMLNYVSVDRDEELHITSFDWVKIIDLAKMIGSKFGVNYYPNNRIDVVQQDKRNEPNNTILKYWKPKINLSEGIDKIIEELK